MWRGCAAPAAPFCGALLAAAFQHYFYLPLEAAKRLDPPPAKTDHTTWARAASLAVAPLVLHLLGETLAQLSGWQNDIPAMFDVAAAPMPRVDAPYLAVRSVASALYGCYLSPSTCLSW